MALGARHLAGQRFYKSPFSVQARVSGRFFLGGKLDDITVVVCRVTDLESDEAKKKVSEKGKVKGADKENEPRHQKTMIRSTFKSKL